MTIKSLADAIEINQPRPKYKMSVSKNPSTSLLTVDIGENPSVSIVIPTYNEASNIETVVNSFLASKYPNLLEIVVVDGQSNDGTSKKLQLLAEKSPLVKLAVNPQRIQSAALNIGLKACRGDIFIRADAHCQYGTDYIEQCVSALQNSEALNVGGCQRFVAREPFQAAIALASRSWLGSGGAKYRDPTYNGYADTVYLGCFKREALLKLNSLPDRNVFDTSQVTNEDAELNQRLLARNPRAIYVSSRIKVWYYPRKDWVSLWVQYFKYGRGRCLNISRHPERSQIRGRLPFLFFSTIILLLILDISLSSINLYMPGICIFGIVLAFLESLRVNLKFRNNFVSDIWRGNPRKAPSFVSRWISCGIVILTMPVAHFTGFGYQLLRNKILNHTDW